MSFESLLCCVEYNMAVGPRVREGGDGKKETRKRGNGERTEASRGDLICRKTIGVIYSVSAGSQPVDMCSSHKILEATPVP